MYTNITTAQAAPKLPPQLPLAQHNLAQDVGAIGAGALSYCGSKPCTTVGRSK